MLDLIWKIQVQIFAQPLCFLCDVGPVIISEPSPPHRVVVGKQKEERNFADNHALFGEKSLKEYKYVKSKDA